MSCLQKESLLVLLLALLIIFESQGQDNLRILGSFIYSNSAYNYEFTKDNTDSYALRISRFQATQIEPNEEEEDTVPEPQSTSSSIPGYYFSEYNQEVFQNTFVKILQDVYKQQKSNELNEKAVEVFYKIEARINFLDDEPVTAYAMLRDKKVKSFLKSNTSPYYTRDLSKIYANHFVKRVTLETEEGTIKNISAKLVIPDDNMLSNGPPNEYLEFKNRFPISVSGKFDADNFSKVNLYCYDCGGIKGLTRFVRLSDIIMLDIVLENDKDDYSPANSITVLSPLQPVQELRKEKRSRILELSAFNDFVGIDDDQPNGLIQIEAKRRININTRYYPLFSGKKDELITSRVNFSAITKIDPPNIKENRKKTKIKSITYTFHEKVKPVDLLPNGLLNQGPTTESGSTIQTKTIKVKTRRANGLYFNFGGSIEPRLLFSKLEENNRFIPLNDDDLANLNEKSDDSKFVIDPVTLYKYQLFSFGINANILKLSFPHLKFHWRLADIGFYYYRDRIQTSFDTTSENSTPFNNGMFVLGSAFEFKPDSRWGASMGVNTIWQKIYNPTFGIEEDSQLLQSILDLHLKTSSWSKVFFRFRYTAQAANLDNNFVQIQLGYSLDFFTGSKITKIN